ncbi:MAG: hypothetical protein IPJ58_16720 [Ardenticatenia bacterium]|nr:hypothetical protein [Ardenticatenia bacterium]
MAELSARLRDVRVASGDWRRVVTDSVLFAPGRSDGVAGVLLDPPYTLEDRTADIYTHDAPIAEAVTEWAKANGDNPRIRIALCGYDLADMPTGWTAHRGRRPGVTDRRAAGCQGWANRGREVIWFSPHCRPVVATMPLFEHAGVTA